MFKIEPYKHNGDGDPAVSFASDDEIEIADQLRRQLEERYLATSARIPPLPVRSGEGR